MAIEQCRLPVQSSPSIGNQRGRGARAKGDFRPDSDYDILAVVSHQLEPRERLPLSSSCRLQLARMGIDAEVPEVT